MIKKRFYDKVYNAEQDVNLEAQFNAKFVHDGRSKYIDKGSWKDISPDMVLEWVNDNYTPKSRAEQEKVEAVRGAFTFLVKADVTEFISEENNKNPYKHFFFNGVNGMLTLLKRYLKNLDKENKNDTTKN